MERSVRVQGELFGELMLNKSGLWMRSPNELSKLRPGVIFKAINFLSLDSVRSLLPRILDIYLENWGSNPVWRSFDFSPQFSMRRTHGDEVYKLRFGWDLLEACWEFVGCLLGVWFVKSILSKQLFQWALQMALQKSSANELSKLRPGWSLLGVCWGSAGSPLGVRWESPGNPLGVRWESAGSPLGVCWESTGSQLRVCWESTLTNLTISSELISTKALNQTLQKLSIFHYLYLGTYMSFQHPYIFMAHPVSTFATL